jgi:hypothetical protein
LETPCKKIALVKAVQLVGVKNQSRDVMFLQRRDQVHFQHAQSTTAVRDDDQGRLDGQWAAVPAAGDFELSRLVTRVKSGEWAGDRVKARP